MTACSRGYLEYKSHFHRHIVCSCDRTFSADYFRVLSFSHTFLLVLLAISQVEIMRMYRALIGRADNLEKLARCVDASEYLGESQHHSMFCMCCHFLSPSLLAVFVYVYFEMLFLW